MIYGYARTSKTEQELALQIDSLEKYGVDKVYQEQVSGVKKRPELEKLLSTLQSGDALVVWKLDRIGRTTKELVLLLDDLDKRGINFISLTESIDTSTPMGKFLITVLCAMAAMERDVLIMRTKAGLDAARKRGRIGGRPKISKDKADFALKLYNNTDYTIKEICEKADISRSTLYRLIKDYTKESEGN